MSNIPSTHTSVAIDLKEYGAEGRIVMSTPDVLRITAMQNSLFSYLLTDEQIEAMERMDKYERTTYLQRIQLRKMSTVTLLSILSCISEAPFHINDYCMDMELDVKSFLTYISDKRELYNRLLTEWSNIEGADPLS